MFNFTWTLHHLILCKNASGINVCMQVNSVIKKCVQNQSNDEANDEGNKSNYEVRQKYRINKKNEECGLDRCTQFIIKIGAKSLFVCKGIL